MNQPATLPYAWIFHWYPAWSVLECIGQVSTYGSVPPYFDSAAGSLAPTVPLTMFCVLHLPVLHTSCLQRLLAYFAGHNDEGRKMPPTVPLDTDMYPVDEKSETVKGKFTVGMYIPEEHQVRALSCVLLGVEKGSLVIRKIMVLREPVMQASQRTYYLSQHRC